MKRLALVVFLCLSGLFSWAQFEGPTGKSVMYNSETFRFLDYRVVVSNQLALTGSDLSGQGTNATVVVGLHGKAVPNPGAGDNNKSLSWDGVAQTWVMKTTSAGTVAWNDVTAKPTVWTNIASQSYTIITNAPWLTDMDITTPTVSGTFDGITTEFVAGESLSFGQATRMTTNANIVAASAFTEPTARVLALCTGSVSNTATGTFLLQGLATSSSWSWTPGDFVYLSTNATGTLTQTLPSGADTALVILGIATATNSLYFNPQLVIIELSE